MMTPKEHFIAELEPLLLEAESALETLDEDKARACATALLLLVRDYALFIPRAEIRKALNHPTANRIAKRFGVAP